MGGGASKKSASGEVLVAEGLVGQQQAQASEAGSQQPAAPQQPAGEAAPQQPDQQQSADAAASAPRGSPEKPKAAPEMKRPRVAKKGSTKLKDEAPAKEDGKEEHKVLASSDDDSGEETRAEAQARLAAAAEAAAPAPAPAPAPAAAAAAAEPASPPRAAAAAKAEEVAPQPIGDVTVEELLAACREGRADVVQAFLTTKAKTAKGLAEYEEALFDAYGDSVLHHGAHSGSDKVVKLLLELGKVQVDIPNARNETALQIACRRGNPAVVDLLLQAAADPNRQDSSGLTPFLSAVFAGASEEMLELLVKAQADVSAQDARGVGALHFGALRGDTVLIQWLLKRKANVDMQTEHCTTPLMLAAKRGNTDCVTLLLNNRASTALADEAGCTALMQALAVGNDEAAKKILKAGASVDAIDCAGRSALFHAVLGGSLEGLKAVLECGGRVNILDEEGRSPLYQACLMSADDLVKCLLAAEADPNLAGRGSMVRPGGHPAIEEEEEAEDSKENHAARACLDESRTCLQVCATLAHNSVLASLLEKSADLNAAPGALGWTALHLCAAVNNEEGATLLLQKGALTSLEDAEGNTAGALAERAGHETVMEKIKEAAAKEPKPSEVAGVPSPAARRNNPLRGSLPPLHGAPEPDPPVEELEPLAAYKEAWEQRRPDGSLLDRVFGPMVHDAMRSDQWRDRWEALTYLSKNFGEAAGSPADVVSAIGEILSNAARDKVPKVFLASLSVFEELLSDARADVLGPEEFTALLRGQQSDQGETTGPSCDALLVLLDQTDAHGGSSAAASPQQAAADALCSCITNGRVPLDEAAWPLLTRIDERLRLEAKHDTKDRKEAALAPKCLAANLKLLGRWLSAFGLQQSGLFRRALVLPLLLRAVASEHSKARAAAGDALVQLMALSGGMEERIWNLLPSKVRKAVQRLASGHEGVSLLSAVPCEEDAMAKSVIVSEDERAGAFLCVSELTPQVWASTAAGERLKASSDKSSKTASSAKAAVANAAAATTNSSKAGESSSYGVADDGASEALAKAFASKNWKDRVETIQTLARELASAGDGVKLVEDTVEGSGGGPLLSQYVLRGHRISMLQASLSTLLGDVVTAVFVAAADLLRLICSHVPLYIAPLFLEPLLLPLVGRLLDTSGKVRAKSVETTLEVAALHGCALSEMIAQCVASGSAWSSAAPPQTSSGSGSASSSQAHGRDCDRSTGPRLQLLVQLVKQVQAQDSAGKWTDETWKALAEYAMRAAEHRNGDVRKEAAALLNSMTDIGDRAGAVADHAVAQLQALAQQRMCKRPGTMSNRPLTNGRLGTSMSRPSSNAGSTSGLNASGRLSTSQRLNTSQRSLASSGFTLNMNSTGRLSTASRSRAGGTGSSFRPRTGSTLRPGTGLRERDIDEESDNSIPEESAQPEPPLDGSDGAEGGIKFTDVQNSAAMGANEVPELAEGEQALREALPLAEALDEVALDFVAPLIALFGDGWTRCFYSRNWQCRVAALTHLSSSMTHRLEEITGPEVSPNALGELLDGAMRAVHEGLGDQNVRVYAEACLAVTAVVPAFCGAVDGRLLVAHLAPLLRQLCARMGDSKEVVRMQTVQALFRLLHPPTGNIVSPVAVAMLILRHLAPAKEEGGQGGDSPASIAKGGPNKGAATGWLCRLGALRDLCKEYSKVMVFQPGATTPGEWLRLKDGLVHGDPTVRYETARLYALVCKMHLKCLGDEEAQKPGREAWVAALPKDTPPKSTAQVRRLLKLPEQEEKAEDDQPSFGGTGKLGRSITAPLQAWEVPDNVGLWAGCKIDVLRALRFPAKGDEKAVITALRALGKAVCAHTDAAKRGGASSDEAFAAICRAVMQAMGSPAGADRSVFLCAVDLCQTAVAQLAPVLSGLDINMNLAKLFPTLMERTSTTGGVDVKIGVASDKLVQQLAKHPKVGAEAVTKMVISAIARTEAPIRPLVLLRTLLSDFGLRLCAQRDVVMLMLGAIGIQLERVGGNNPEQGTENESLRTQLVGVLATCNNFSQETVHYCMSEVDPAHRKLISYALAEAPNPKLVALGATAAEQETAEVAHVAGSAVRALSRSRGLSPKPGHDGSGPDMSPLRRSTGQLPGSGEPLRNSGEMRKSGSRPALPKPEDKDGDGMGRSSSTRALGEGSNMREASPRSNRRTRHRVIDASGGEASTAASTDCAPYQTGGSSSSGLGLDSSQRSVRWGGETSGPARPPAPMGLSTALGSNATYKFREGEAEESNSRSMKRVGSSDGRFLKSKEKTRDDSLGALMDVLSQMENTRTKTR